MRNLTWFGVWVISLFMVTLAPAVAPGAQWSHQAKLTAADAGEHDYFGISASISGDKAIVGAWANYGVEGNYGAAFVFGRTGTTWAQEAKLTASDAASAKHFGRGVSICGETAIVGATSQAPSQEGRVYLFQYDGSTWSEVAMLTASDSKAGDRFGWSVSVFDDTVIVGAIGLTTGADTAAYIFRRDGPTWTQEARLDPPDEPEDFGRSVSIYGDTAIVGAPGDDNPGGYDAGSAYIFQRDGTTWTQTTKLVASDPDLGANFGWSVSIFDNKAAVGAYEASSAYIFERTDSAWTEIAKLTPSTGSGEFGRSVSIWGDHAIVGRPYPGPSAYIFEAENSSWTEVAKLTAYDGEGGDLFGYCVAMSGGTVIVAAPGGDSAYIFVPEPTTLLLIGTGMAAVVGFVRRRRG